jgi:uncharacterized protein (DUF1330 family)
MNYYFIAHIRINDLEEYHKYIDKSGAVFAKYKGEYLSVDNDATLLEGKYDYTRTVMIKFDSKSDFEDWYYSDEYQAILKHRLNAADCDTMLIQGI